MGVPDFSVLFALAASARVLVSGDTTLEATAKLVRILRTAFDWCEKGGLKPPRFYPPDPKFPLSDEINQVAVFVQLETCLCLRGSGDP